MWYGNRAFLELIIFFVSQIEVAFFTRSYPDHVGIFAAQWT